jgi:hypothetical protein
MYILLLLISNVIHKMLLYLVQGVAPLFVGTLHLWTYIFFFDVRS